MTKFSDSPQHSVNRMYREFQDLFKKKRGGGGETHRHIALSSLDACNVLPHFGPNPLKVKMLHALRNSSVTSFETQFE